MPRITRVYTRTGDDGTTGLGTGTRVPKDDLRVESYGTVDELSSSIGVALAGDLPERLVPMLTRIQNELFDVGADLCMPEEERRDVALPCVDSKDVARLEAWMDELQGELEPLANFVLPGGSACAAQLHVARCVCRRAERRVVTLQRDVAINSQTVRYLNRLSDALFVMARYANHDAGVAEPTWRPDVQAVDESPNS